MYTQKNILECPIILVAQLIILPELTSHQMLCNHSNLLEVYLVLGLVISYALAFQRFYLASAL